MILGYFFLFLHKDTFLILIRGTSINLCCGYSLEMPHHCTSNEYPQHALLCGKLEKIVPNLSSDMYKCTDQ